jgi:hypothetical protein
MSTMFIFSTLSPLSSALCVLVLEEQKLMVNEQIHQALTPFYIRKYKLGNTWWTNNYNYIIIIILL